MQNILGASWKTTVIGFIGAVLNYFVTLGPNLPVTSADWGHAAVSAMIFAFGTMTKDANVTNSQHPAEATAVSQIAAVTPNPAAITPTPAEK